MCGIAGYLRFDRDLSAEELTERVAAMAARLTHRGPDDHGVWVDPELRCALAHRRLSVIDLSAAGRQPMTSRDGRHVITYNGEIYNFLELRGDLEKRGPLRTRTDTEVLLESLAQDGLAALPRLDGMYAFGSFDTRTGELLLARDPFGEKPLYFLQTRDCLAFASELHALQALPEFDDTVEVEAIAEYLALQYIDAPRTLYRGVRKLEPGHALRVDGQGGLRPERHFVFRPGVDPLEGRSLDEQADELEEILLRSLRRRLVADVPLGALLSGGIDSSLTVALVTKRLGKPVQTFSLGFGDSPESEHHLARRISRDLGTEHHEEVVTPQMAGELVAFAGEHDEPNGDASCWPVWRLSKLARQYVTVALSGDGGDELFGGYARYLSLLRSAEWRDRLGAGFYSRFQLFFPEDSIAGLLGFLPPQLSEQLTELQRELDWSSVSELSRMRASDVLHYLPGAVLAKVDRMSMRHSLEVRTPFLSRELAAFAERLPDEALVQKGRGKAVVRHLLARYLPREISEAPKRGFGAGMTSSWAGQAPERELRRLLGEARSPLGRCLRAVGLESFLAQGRGDQRRVYQLSALLTLEGYLRGRPAALPEQGRTLPLSKVSKPTSTSPGDLLQIQAWAASGEPLDLYCDREVPDLADVLPAGSRLVTPLPIEPPDGLDAVQWDWEEAEPCPPGFAPEPRQVILASRAALGLPATLLDAFRLAGTPLLFAHAAEHWIARRVDREQMRSEQRLRRFRPLLLKPLHALVVGLRFLLRDLASKRNRPPGTLARAAQRAYFDLFSPRLLGRIVIPLVVLRDKDGCAVEARWRRRPCAGPRKDLSADWLLYEDGRPLGRPGEPKRDVRRLGNGRYRVEGPNAYFSASDDTSPLDNGRLYTLMPRAARFAEPIQRLVRWMAATDLPAAAVAEVARCGAAEVGDLLAADPVGAVRGWPGSRYPLRVALFAASLGAGGAERQLTLLACELRRRGHAVRVILQEPPRGTNAHYLPTLLDAGVEVRSAHPRESTPAPASLARAHPEALRCLAALPKDVGERAWRSFVHLALFEAHGAFSVLDTANVCGGLAAALAGVPATLVTARSVNPTHYPWHRPWYHDYYRAVLRSPRVAIGANSRFGAEDYAAWLGIDPESFFVVHNGLDAAAFERPDDAARAVLRAELGLGRAEPVVAGVMRFTAEKQPLYFVDMAAAVHARLPEARFLLIGDGPMAGEVRERAAGHGLGEALRLLGPRRDARRILAIADVVALTSAVEGHPNVPLEAQALGIPVVATRVGGVAETVVEDRTALLCDAQDPAGMGALVAELIGDRARRERMGAAGRLHAEEHFPVECMTDAVLAALGEIAAAGARS